MIAERNDGNIEGSTILTYVFCPKCSVKLKHGYDHEEVRQMCQECGFVLYHNPVPAVAGVLYKNNDVLLVRRKYEPRKGMWSLPAGFMEVGETQLEGLRREIYEETKITIANATLLCVEDGMEDPRAHVILIAFLIDAWHGTPEPEDDADKIGWFDTTSLPQNMAWSSHIRVLEKHTEGL